MGIMESRLIHGTVGFAIGDALGLPVRGSRRPIWLLRQSRP